MQRGAKGVGLYRSEIPFMLRERFPGEEEQRAIYRQQLSHFANKPDCAPSILVRIKICLISALKKKIRHWAGVVYALPSIILRFSQRKFVRC